MDPPDLLRALSQFASSDSLHSHPSPLTEAFEYTDGVKFLADQAGAYWLLDLIASWQKRARRDSKLRDFQLWEIRVDTAKRRGVVICLRDAGDEAFRQHLPLTDFPLPSVKLYLENGVLMLPSER